MVANRKFEIGALLAAMMLVGMTFVPMVSAQAETLSDSSDVKQVTLTMDQKDGVLIIPLDDKKITDLSTANTTKKRI
ncbi:hypothetical protein [Methanosarcina sp. WH1]|uniref:hypothetical protein n=1 Tax=Methanosarcina sp. WH1 TaxID=1434102 RepID=UPI0006154BEF|nr:hypothetical protein [Methanosarcina sp. WH1]AKB22975.1 hypothetical protein MSWH1_2704 [Methanosarcina sp. WH1]